MAFSPKVWIELSGPSYYCCNQRCGHRWGAELEPPLKWQFAAAVFKLLGGNLQRTSSWTQIPITVNGANGKEEHPLRDILRLMVGREIGKAAMMQAHGRQLRMVQEEAQMRAEIEASGDVALVARLEGASQEDIGDIWLELHVE